MNGDANFMIAQMMKGASTIADYNHVGRSFSTAQELVPGRESDTTSQLDY